MPTPVSTARQCLTDEAARALDDAVAVARRRSHAQTTSLHAVSALLSLPSSALREACTRSRYGAYSPRLQFKALELSVGVSLDRLPTTKSAAADPDGPPISNSLMAAIKRSQATQRRHPDTFHLYQQLHHQNPSSSSSISAVKVELKHFILSILDDPIVSRVFGEAGFKSTDLKLSILNPPPKFSKTRYPPLFLCNLPDLEANKRGFGFNFPFSSGSTENADDDVQRICDVLFSKSARNPLLIGAYATDALSSFVNHVKNSKSRVLPEGLNVISIEKEISEGVNKETVGLKLKEIEDMVGRGAKVMVNYGELRMLVESQEKDGADFLVEGLKGLVERYGNCNSNGKLWLIGATAGYDTYMKFSGRFVSVDKDWDLHFLPITSSTSSATFGAMHSKSSLMGSFVPFAGFFPMPSEFQTQRSNAEARCSLCNEKYEEEVSIMKGGSTFPSGDRLSSNLSPWLQMSECDSTKKLGTIEAKDDNTVLQVRVDGLERKWNDICQRLHQSGSCQQDAPQTRPFPGVEHVNLSAASEEGGNRISSLEESRFADRTSSLPLYCKNIYPVNPDISTPVTSGAEVSFRGLNTQRVGKGEMQRLPSCAPSSPFAHKLSPPVTSITTDLGLGTLYASAKVVSAESNFQDHNRSVQYLSGSTFVDSATENASNSVAQSSSGSYPQSDNHLDAKDYKYLLKVLAERVCWQGEAISRISRTVSHCRYGQGRRHGIDRGNIWLSFLGPDKVAKRKIAAALAEIIFGSRESLLSVDLNPEDGISCSNSILNHQKCRSYDVNSRTMLVDYIADRLGKKFHSVVLLENIDKADLFVQNSLCQAIKTGKFPDSHGRECSVNNTIFVITSSMLKSDKDHREQLPKFSEERISAAQYSQFQLVVRSASDGETKDNPLNVMRNPGPETLVPCPPKRRKLMGSNAEDESLEERNSTCKTSRSSFDLNLPVQDMEEDNDNDSRDSSDSCSESSKAWLEELLDQVDENIVFKPFDFDALSEKIMSEIRARLRKLVGVNVLLEIDPEAVVQILAAAWLSDKKQALEDWIEQVLCSSITEAKQRYEVTANSVMKLIPCEGVLAEEQFSGICLPAKIIFN